MELLHRKTPFSLYLTVAIYSNMVLDMAFALYTTFIEWTAAFAG